MDAKVEAALRDALQRCLPILADLTPTCLGWRVQWSRRDDGGWQGSRVQAPSCAYILEQGRESVDHAGTNFAEIFFSIYPEYGEGKLVGCAGMMAVQLAHNKPHIFRSFLTYIWQTYKHFNCNRQEVDEAISAFARFVDSPIIRVRFQSLLLNFNTPADRISLPEDIVIRKLPLHEISDFREDSEEHGHTGASRMGIHEFVIEGEMDRQKTFNGSGTDVEIASVTAARRLDKAVRAFRTFKEGPIGFDLIEMKFVGFCPLLGRSFQPFFDKYIPPGKYEILANEVTAFTQHAHWIFTLSDAAMESACSRLTDAESRSRSQDQALDAVIGMEALLLSGMEEKTELRFRFALNYSMLFQGIDGRRTAYKQAKDLYDLRSKIAHGSSIPAQNIRIGEDKVSLIEASKRAKSALRFLIHRFLPEANNPPYKRSEFWEDKYFGK